MKKSILLVLVLVFISKVAMADGVPTLLNFTGFIRTNTGPYEGPAKVTLSFYPQANGGEALWQETQDVLVQSGRFYVLLGANPSNPLPSTLLEGSELYLGIKVNEGAEMSPRLRVASVPYALRAADASLLGGHSPDDFALATHSHDFSDITGTVDVDQLPAMVVLHSELDYILEGYATLDYVNGALAGKADKVHGHAISDVLGLQEALDGKASVTHRHQISDLEAGTCTQGQVIKLAASGWVCGADNDTTYTAGTGLVLQGQQFSVDKGTIENWAKGVCYDTPQELASALPSWDQNASDDLTVSTDFGGDVIGKYNDLQIAAGAVGTKEIADGSITFEDIGKNGCSANQVIQLDSTGNGWVCGPSLARPPKTAGAVAYGTASGGYDFTTVPGQDGLFLRSKVNGAPVWGGLEASDIPPGSNNYIQNQNSGAQNASFWINGTARIGGGLWVWKGTAGEVRVYDNGVDIGYQNDPPSDYGVFSFRSDNAGNKWTQVGTVASSSPGPSPGQRYLELTGPDKVVIKTGTSASTVAEAAVFYGPKRDGTTGPWTVSVGHGYHDIAASVVGATIAGGGNSNYGNKVASGGHYGAVGGGYGNTVGGVGAVIPGGALNTANGDYSFAAGYDAHADMEGCFVWNSGTSLLPTLSLKCKAAGEFRARAPGGFYFHTRADNGDMVTCQLFVQAVCAGPNNCSYFPEFKCSKE